MTMQDFHAWLIEGDSIRTFQVAMGITLLIGGIIVHIILPIWDRWTKPKKPPE